MYKIIKNDKILLETNEIGEVVRFCDGEGVNEIKILNFENVLNEFIEQIENNAIYDMSLQEYINSCLCSIGEIDMSTNDIEKLYKSEYVIIQMIDWNSGDSWAYVCSQNEHEIALSIRYLLNYTDDFKLEL